MTPNTKMISELFEEFDDEQLLKYAPFFCDFCCNFSDGFFGGGFVTFVETFFDVFIESRSKRVDSSALKSAFFIPVLHC